MRLNVGVVFGGKSVEHEVSIISALQMIENMNQLKYNPMTIYLSKENEFYFHEDMSDIEFFKDMERVKLLSHKVIFHKKNDHLELYKLSNYKLKKICQIDIIFLIVHGTSCEDGTLSAYFELLHVPYVGSNVLSSAINQNKWKLKQILDYNGISVVPFKGFYENEFYEEEEYILSQCEQLGYPLIVKPASLGSSVGITKCGNRSDLYQGILSALQYDNEILVEKVIEPMMELNCSVLGDDAYYDTSFVERVFQQDEILSYQDKYLRGDTKNSKGMESTNRELPAKISESLTKEVEELSKQAAKIVGTSGVIRIDYIFDKKEDNLYLNEINTIPGSLAFYLWRAKNVSYKVLIDRLIQIALRKYRVKNSKMFSYESNLLSLKKQFSKGKLLK